MSETICLFCEETMDVDQETSVTREVVRVWVSKKGGRDVVVVQVVLGQKSNQEMFI